MTRYLGLVYHMALRLVNGNTHMAEDVAQVVFTDLAAPPELSPLIRCSAAGFIARLVLLRARSCAENAAASPERQAAEMNAQNNTPDDPPEGTHAGP